MLGVHVQNDTAWFTQSSATGYRSVYLPPPPCVVSAKKKKKRCAVLTVDGVVTCRSRPSLHDSVDKSPTSPTSPGATQQGHPGSNDTKAHKLISKKIKAGPRHNSNTTLPEKKLILQQYHTPVRPSGHQLTPRHTSSPNPMVSEPRPPYITRYSSRVCPRRVPSSHGILGGYWHIQQRLHSVYYERTGSFCAGFVGVSW